MSDLRDTIASDLRTCDIISLADSTSELRKIIYSIRGQETFFKTVTNDLLRYAISADWMKIQKLVNKYPHLMFKKSLVTILGKEMEFSPLEYVAYVSDWYSLKILKNALKNDMIKQFLKVIKSYAYVTKAKVTNKEKTLLDPCCHEFIKLIDRWLAKDKAMPVTLNDLQNYIVAQTLLLSEQKSSYSLRPFYWVCEALIYVMGKGSHIDDIDKDEFFYNVYVFAKNSILPSHMRRHIKAYHYPDGKYRSWVESGFNQFSFSTDFLITDYRASVYLRHDGTEVEVLKNINTDCTDHIHDFFEKRSIRDVEVFTRLEIVRAYQMHLFYIDEYDCTSGFYITSEIKITPAEPIICSLNNRKYNDNPPGKGFIM